MISLLRSACSRAIAFRTRAGADSGSSFRSRQTALRTNTRAAKTMVAAASATGGAETPAESDVPMAMLTPKHGNVGKWDVCVAEPRVHTGTYMRNGNSKTFVYFECVLVSLKDPTQYCLGEVRTVRGSTLTPEQIHVRSRTWTCLLYTSPSPRDRG